MEQHIPLFRRYSFLSFFSPLLSLFICSDTNKLVAALSSTKHANYLSPLALPHHYNLAILYLQNQQYFSAFLSISSCISLYFYYSNQQQQQEDQDPRQTFPSIFNESFSFHPIFESPNQHLHELFLSSCFFAMGLALCYLRDEFNCFESFQKVSSLLHIPASIQDLEDIESSEQAYNFLLFFYHQAFAFYSFDRREEAETSLRSFEKCLIAFRRMGRQGEGFKPFVDRVEKRGDALLRFIEQHA